MDSLYREYLLDHYHNPKNFGTIKDAEIHKHDINISCGDEVEMFVKLEKKEHNKTENSTKKDNYNKKEKFDDQKIKDIKFSGRGCVICMAAASILTEELIGKKIKDIKNMSTNDLLELLQLQLTPTRVKCAMLGLVTLKKGILEYESSAR